MTKKEKKKKNNRGWTVKPSWSCIGERKIICAGLFIILFSSSADIKNCPFLFQMWTCRNKQSLYHFKTKIATEFKGSNPEIVFQSLQTKASYLLNMVTAEPEEDNVWQFKTVDCVFGIIQFCLCQNVSICLPQKSRRTISIIKLISFYHFLNIQYMLFTEGHFLNITNITETDNKNGVLFITIISSSNLIHPF